MGKRWRPQGDLNPRRRRERAVPVYEQLEGWKEDLSDAREFGELPKTAQKYVRRLEELAGVEVSLISVGADRNQTILRKNPFRA